MGNIWSIKITIASILIQNMYRHFSSRYLFLGAQNVLLLGGDNGLEMSAR